MFTDHLGAPLCLLDDEGGVAWQGAHDGYGRYQTTGDAGLCPFRWPGQYEDSETGLHYNRFRYYDPESGQYLSRDPLDLEGGFQPYAYAHDPTTWVDPLGLQPGEGCGAADTEGQVTRRQALNSQKDALGIPRSQQPTRSWTVHDPARVKGPGVRARDPRSQGRIYEYEIAGPGGATRKVYIADHHQDPLHGGIGHVHQGVPKPGASSVEPGGRYSEVGEPVAYDTR